VIPEDRSDLLYHYYNGGGTTASGPALLVRKGIGEHVSAYASYFVDNVSSASIDVVTTASPFKESGWNTAAASTTVRNTTVGLSLLRSNEPDYVSNTVGATVAHEVLDGLTTFSLGYNVGRDEVGKAHTDFADHVNRYQYKLGVSQVVTKSLLMNLNYEAILEDGYLHSPYRAARLLGLSVPEVYPRTRAVTRSHWALSRDGLDRRPAQHVGASALSLFPGYLEHPRPDRRAGIQDPFRRPLAGRTALSPLQAIGGLVLRQRLHHADALHGAGPRVERFFEQFARCQGQLSIVQSALQLQPRRLNFDYETIRYTYNNFTDVRTGRLYAYNANVFQLFLSGWF